jgi:hypothetical protein
MYRLKNKIEFDFLYETDTLGIKIKCLAYVPLLNLKIEMESYLNIKRIESTIDAIFMEEYRIKDIIREYIEDNYKITVE